MASIGNGYYLLSLQRLKKIDNFFKDENILRKK